jgi:hypothetical protein
VEKEWEGYALRMIRLLLRQDFERRERTSTIDGVRRRWSWHRWAHDGEMVKKKGGGLCEGRSELQY